MDFWSSTICYVPSGSQHGTEHSVLAYFYMYIFYMYTSQYMLYVFMATLFISAHGIEISKCWVCKITFFIRKPGQRRRRTPQMVCAPGLWPPSIKGGARKRKEGLLFTHHPLRGNPYSLDPLLGINSK